MDTISGVVPFLVAHVARSMAADPEPLLRGSGVDVDAPPKGDAHILGSLAQMRLGRVRQLPVRGRQITPAVKFAP